MRHLFIIIGVTFGIFSLFLVGETSAQTDFRPGYIITNEFDTIHGLIDYRGDIRNCKVCLFKNESQYQTVTYQPGEILAYRFAGSKYYISKVLPTDSLKEPVFAEYLVDGIVDLFYYADNTRSYYFIEQENGKITELDIKKKERDEIDGIKGNYVFIYKKYIGLLKVVFNKCPGLFPEIDHAELTHKSLAGITKKYHDYICDDQQCIQYVKEIPKAFVNLCIYTGINHSKINISSGDFFSQNYEKSLYPSFGVLADLRIPHLNEKISLQVNTEISKNYFRSIEINRPNSNFKTLEIESSPIDLFGGLKYSYPKGKIRPTFYFGGGLTYLAGLKTSNRLEIINGSTVRTYLSGQSDLRKKMPGIVGSIGFDYFKKLKRYAHIKLNYKINPKNSSNGLVSIETLNMNIGFYLF